MYDVFEQLLQKHNVTAYRVAKEAGVTQTALTEVAAVLAPTICHRNQAIQT